MDRQEVVNAVMNAAGAGFELRHTRGLLDTPDAPPNWTVG